MMKSFGLIGHTLSHSFSKDYFTKKFAALGLADHSYLNFELKDIADFSAMLAANKNLRGLNITIPYKEQVVQFLHTQNFIVQQTGACNCIKLENGLLHGFNTDAIGFSRSLQPLLKPHHTRALVLGTGGASRAIQFALRELHINYLLVSRNSSHNTIAYSDISKNILEEYLLIINTTPLGMFPAIDTYPDLPYHLLTTHHLLFDIVYNPAKTIFLLKGEEQGAQFANGYTMLIEQAEESWRIWNS